VLIENNTLALLHIPAMLLGLNTLAAESRAFKCVFGNMGGDTVLETDMSHREVVGILGDPIAPSRKHYMEVLGELVRLHVLINDLVLLGEAKELRVLTLLGNADHHLEIGRTNDVTGGMPTEELCGKGSRHSLNLECFRILIPQVRVIVERVLHIREYETTMLAIAQLGTRGIGSAGTAGLEVDRRNVGTKLAIGMGNLQHIGH